MNSLQMVSAMGAQKNLKYYHLLLTVLTLYAAYLITHFPHNHQNLVPVIVTRANNNIINVFFSDIVKRTHIKTASNKPI